MKRNCSIDGCDKPARARGWCVMHWNRWRKHGDPLRVDKGGQPIGMKLGAANNRWAGDEATYSGMHQRLHRVKGRAADQTCSCGSRAAHWAYDHADPNEKTGTLRRGFTAAYSLDPDHYVPMCIPCHKKFDLETIKEKSA